MQPPNQSLGLVELPGREAAALHTTPSQRACRGLGEGPLTGKQEPGGPQMRRLRPGRWVEALLPPTVFERGQLCTGGGPSCLACQTTEEAVCDLLTHAHPSQMTLPHRGTRAEPSSLSPFVWSLPAHSTW